MQHETTRKTHANRTGEAPSAPPVPAYQNHHESVRRT